MIELSCDLGEASTERDRAIEQKIWPMIDAANVACGGHAGDERSMRAASVLAITHGIILGCHPSYPDRPNFGRKSMDIDRDALRRSLSSQISALREICEAFNLALERVKPHGALYNDAHRDAELSKVIVDAMIAVDPELALVASDRGEMAAAARAKGITVIREAFADRRYQPDGSLVPRSEKGSLLSVEEAAAQAGMLAEDRAVISRDGTRLELDFDTVCIHADMDHSVDRLKAIRQRLGM